MSYKFRATAVAVMAVIATSAAHAEFNANIEFDNTYLNNQRGLGQSGRVELNAMGKAGKNMFIAGKAAFLAKKDGGVSTDDMWVQLGSAAGDVKLGRFEGADLFPVPRDALVLYAGGDGAVYRGQVLRGRFGNTTGTNAVASNGQGVFHAAGTLNIGGGLSLELGLVEAHKSNQNNKGLRPVVQYAAGPLTVRAGIEAIKYAGGNSETGVAATGAYDLGGFTPSVNVAMGKNAAGQKQSTYGVFVNTAFGAAAGYIHAQTKVAGSSNYKTDTFYVAYTMPLFDIAGASATIAASTSKGSGSNIAEDENGVKLRFNYGF